MNGKSVSIRIYPYSGGTNHQNRAKNKTLNKTITNHNAFSTDGVVF